MFLLNLFSGEKTPGNPRFTLPGQISKSFNSVDRVCEPLFFVAARNILWMSAGAAAQVRTISGKLFVEIKKSAVHAPS